MRVSEAIKKYDLTEQKKDCFGMPYNYKVYSREEWKNGTQTIYSVIQDELAKEEGENLYFLHIQKIYHNQVVTNKYGYDRAKGKTTITQLEND